jgi:tripartite-type tricarboxylate transporter receptor subunit TctC
VLNYASSGQGGQSHITAEVFNSAVGIEAVHLPYKGAAPAQQAVCANAFIPIQAGGGTSQLMRIHRA